VKIDEKRLEEAFWDFDRERTITGAERDAFKHKARALLRAHLRPLCTLLDRAAVYLVAYTTHHTPPGDMERARHLKKEILEVLEEYRRSMCG
jgi:hypothetical protein